MFITNWRKIFYLSGIWIDVETMLCVTQMVNAGWKSFVTWRAVAIMHRCFDAAENRYGHQTFGCHAYAIFSKSQPHFVEK